MLSDLALDACDDEAAALGHGRHEGRLPDLGAGTAAQTRETDTFDALSTSARNADRQLGRTVSARTYGATKDQLKNRLKRAEGQVRGVGKMIDEDRRCVDVLIQISAIQAALDKVALALLDEHVSEAMTTARRDDRDDKVNELMAAIGRIKRR